LCQSQELVGAILPLSPSTSMVCNGTALLYYVWFLKGSQNIKKMNKQNALSNQMRGTINLFSEDKITCLKLSAYISLIDL
jgi:hypothetical protein